LYILLFTFLDITWEDKRFWTEWNEALAKSLVRNRPNKSF
jgi:hypothetical protein